MRCRRICCPTAEVFIQAEKTNIINKYKPDTQRKHIPRSFNMQQEEVETLPESLYNILILVIHTDAILSQYITVPYDTGLATK